MTRALSPEEWALEWSPFDPQTVGKLMSLGEFTTLVNRCKADIQRRYPGIDLSNERYVAHLERCLERGVAVPLQYIAAVKDDDLRFDGSAFPLLCAARTEVRANKPGEYLGVTSPGVCAVLRKFSTAPRGWFKPDDAKRLQSKLLALAEKEGGPALRRATEDALLLIEVSA